MYNDYDNSGFLFTYKSKLGKSEYLSENDILSIPDGKGNDDNLFIFCYRCEEYMDFNGGSVSLTGKWVCPKCKRGVREQTPYDRLCKENEEFCSSFDIFDDDDDYY